jgi:hypothetical protein
MAVSQAQEMEELGERRYLAVSAFPHKVGFSFAARDIV